jgi:hypothetical protein
MSSLVETGQIEGAMHGVGAPDLRIFVFALFFISGGARRMGALSGTP